MTRTPEDVAREVRSWECCCSPEGDCSECAHDAASIIAVYAEQVRAETLAGFEWETAMEHYRRKDDKTEVARIPVRRRVGPWEADTEWRSWEPLP